MRKLAWLAISLIFFSKFAFTPLAKLDKQEVKVVKEIWEKLGITGKKGWGSDTDLCDEKTKTVDIFIGCDCSFESNMACHVIRVYIKSQNLSTSLPSEFTKFPYLRVLDLSRNYLSGTIPSQWATMRLSKLLLMGNRLSGSFPIALTKMTTLIDLNIEGNRFSGLIPKEIANLKILDKLVLSSNDFTGELPVTIAELTNLTDVRISDNNFTGKIPNFISKWSNINKLHIQGCSFEGPFPFSMSALTQLNDLRITDLKGGVSTFPRLEKLENLRRLILRNCFIHGTIPYYVGHMANLETLDLSFNNLNGHIPLSFSELGNAKHIYLAENNLSGPMPGWVLSSSKDVDVSYNYFTWDASGPNMCGQRLINVVESYKATSNNLNNIHPCLQKDFPCTKSDAQKIHSLHINCGGKEININDTKYECDAQAKGATPYHDGGSWAFSSTGNFLDDDNDDDVYILSNTSNLLNISTFDSELYTTARRTAISLTYYGLCLMNGNYTVRLHFAEIVFTQDMSLGKRVFDVYVQGELKLKNFDIVKEAGGTSRAVIKTYPVNVYNSTLKIQLYWAGKGTTGIPSSGDYGPIISAISVIPNFELPKFGKKMEVGLIAGTVGGGILFLLLVIVILWRKVYIMGGRELRCLDLQKGMFTLRQIKAATKNFDPLNKLGEGGFGAVYMGLLSDGTKIAVKKLSSKSRQGAREFVNEVGIISALRHPNLVNLYGCCVEGSQMLLIYEYMENNSLSHALLGGDNMCKIRLTWPVRLEICLGIARGLVYLHEESHLRIIHRDIKAGNILLDTYLNAKISDFGLAKLFDLECSHIRTSAAGTIGYMAPEYAMRGYLTPKVDVYSFGVVALEIVSGISNNTPIKDDDSLYLIDKAISLNRTGNLLQLVDADLGSEYSEDEALKIINVALLCVHNAPDSRPTMSQASDMLEGRTDIEDFLNDTRPSTTNSMTLWQWFESSLDETCPMSREPCTDSGEASD